MVRKFLATLLRGLYDYAVCVPVRPAQPIVQCDTESVSALARFEVNVSIGGKHLFATDSRIRTYSEEHIRDLVVLFRQAFPGCHIAVTGFGSCTVPFRYAEELELTQPQ